MVQLTSENAARIFGLYPRKGAIQIGSDADLTLVDLQRAGVINIEQWHTRAKRSATIWDGMRTVGAPVMTIVRGKLVAHENKIVGDAGWGTFVTPRR
jgi:dihydroorotase-like cyclic amidohydrolase